MDISLYLHYFEDSTYILHYCEIEEQAAVKMVLLVY